jgi:hypothetical protein
MLRSMDSEPDRRAGPASKTGGTARCGDRDLRYPLVHHIVYGKVSIVHGIVYRKVSTHGIGHHTVTYWRLHDTTGTTAPVPTGSVHSSIPGRESSATNSTSSGPTATVRNPGRSARITLQCTSRTSGENDMESEPRRVLGTRWKRVGTARYGLRLLRFPHYGGTRRFRRRDTQESAFGCFGVRCGPPARSLAPERLMAGPLTFNQTPTGIAGSIPVWSSRHTGATLSGAAVGRQRGSEPRVRGFESYPQSHNTQPFRDLLTGKKLGFEPGQCAFESCSLSQHERGESP